VEKLLRLVLVWRERSRAELDRVYSLWNMFDLEFRVYPKHSSRFFLKKLFDVSGLWEKVKTFIVFLLQTCKYTFIDICAYDKEMMSSPVYHPWAPTSWCTSQCNFLRHHLPYDILYFHTLFSCCLLVHVYTWYTHIPLHLLCSGSNLWNPQTPGCLRKKNPILVGFFWRRNSAAQGVYQLLHMCAQSWNRDCFKNHSNGATKEAPTCAVPVHDIDRFALARQGMGEICFHDTYAQTSRRYPREISSSVSGKLIPL